MKIVNLIKLQLLRMIPYNGPFHMNVIYILVKKCEQIDR